MREIPWHMKEAEQDPEVAELDAFEDNRRAAVLSTRMMFDEMGLNTEPGMLGFEDEVELQVEVDRIEKELAMASIMQRRKQAVRREQGDLAEAAAKGKRIQERRKAMEMGGLELQALPGPNEKQRLKALELMTKSAEVTETGDLYNYELSEEAQSLLGEEVEFARRALNMDFACVCLVHEKKIEVVVNPNPNRDTVISLS